MTGKIAVEEHFAIPETLAKSARYTAPGYWSDLPGRLLDLHGERLSRMDRAGIELAVLSLNPVGIQGIPDVGAAAEMARRANDYLAEQIARRPDRFAGLAALPMQDPQLAGRELSRCVRELGFKGAMVNGFSQLGHADTAVYYDGPEYVAFWAEVVALGVPFYLHPRDPLANRRLPYEGHPWLIGAPWGFAEEAALHALRLAGSGLLDRFPALQIVLGHLGERILFDLSRLDRRLAMVPNRPAKRRMTDYFSSNFHVTTSGHFSTPALTFAMLAIGADRVMFSVDYPFEDNEEAASWFDHAELSEPDRLKIGRTNAAKLFGLGVS